MTAEELLEALPADVAAEVRLTGAKAAGVYLRLEFAGEDRLGLYVVRRGDGPRSEVLARLEAEVDLAAPLSRNAELVSVLRELDLVACWESGDLDPPPGDRGSKGEGVES